MFAADEWVVPTVNGELYTDKPILYFWLALIISKLAGSVNEWTVRLPAALGAIGLVLTTYKIGKDFFNPRVGLIGAAVLATSARVIWEGRWAHLDTLFAFFLTLSMYFAARAVLNRKNRHQFLLAYVFMALATLTKGLIGVVLPGLVLVLFVLIKRDWGLLREARLPSGVGLFLLIAAPWFVLVSHASGGRWLADFIYLHHIQRYTAGLGHRQPVYYYLTTLPLDFLPWTFFCVPALFSYDVDYKSLRQPARLFFSLWFLAVLVFFTASDTKRDLYLLPLFPPLALFVGNYLEDLTRGALPRQQLFRNVVGIGFTILGVACFAAPMVAWFMRREVFYPVLPFALVMAAGCLWIAHAAWKQSPRAAAMATCVTMAAGVVAASITLLPFADRFKSPRPVANEIVRRIPAAAPLYIFADTMDDYNFYTGRAVIPVVRDAAALDQLRRQASSGYVLIKEKDLIQVKPVETEPLEMIEVDRRASGRSWYLLPLQGAGTAK